MCHSHNALHELLPRGAHATRPTCKNRSLRYRAHLSFAQWDSHVRHPAGCAAHSYAETVAADGDEPEDAFQDPVQNYHGGGEYNQNHAQDA